MGTYITVPRSIFEDYLFVKEAYSRREAFLDLVQMATYSTKKIPISGGSITLQRGQVVASIRFLSARWLWSCGKVDRVLDEYENVNLIERKKNGVNTVISIVNYDLYQKPMNTDEHADEHTDEHTDRHTDRHENNKDNNGRNEGTEKKTSNDVQEKFTPRQFIDLWNSICTRMPKAHLTESRAGKIRSRIKEFGENPEETAREIFTRINQSDFLCGLKNGDGHRNFKGDLGWIIENDTNWVKVIEGKYDNKNSTGELFPAAVPQRQRPQPTLGFTISSGGFDFE